MSAGADLSTLDGMLKQGQKLGSNLFDSDGFKKAKLTCLCHEADGEAELGVVQWAQTTLLPSRLNRVLVQCLVPAYDEATGEVMDLTMCQNGLGTFWELVK